MPEDNFQLNTPALPGTVMPFSAEAEQAVLGAVLLEPDCLSTVAEMLPRADYFYQVNNRTIYSAMLDMFTAGRWTSSRCWSTCAKRKTSMKAAERCI